MDTAQSPNKDVVAACSQILPLMLESGLTSTVPEVQGGGFAMTLSAVLDQQVWPGCAMRSALWICGTQHTANPTWHMISSAC